MRVNSFFNQFSICFPIVSLIAFCCLAICIDSSSMMAQENKEAANKEAAKKEAAQKKPAKKTEAKNADIKKRTQKTVPQKATAKKATAKKATAKKVEAKKAAADDHDHDHEHEHEHEHSDETQKKKATAKSPKKATEASDNGVFDPLKTKGAIDDISKELAKVLKLKRKGSRLLFDLPTSYSDADAAFREIRSKSFGGGGGHGSGAFWTQYFTGQNMGGRIQKSEQNFGRNKPNPNGFVCEFVEITGRNRIMEIYGDQADEFVIRIGGGLDPYLLQIVQSKTSFVVQEANGLDSFAGRGDSFESFCKYHPDFVQSQLLPMLKKYGMTTPATRFNSVTRDHVLDLLKPIDKQRITDFNTTFAKLESEKFAERAAAAKELNSKYKDWQDVIRFAIANESFSVEVRAKLQAMVKSNSSESDRELVSLITSADLKNDKEYLVWLLSQSTDNSEKSRIASRLKGLTEQDFGTDTAKWMAWITKTDAAELTSVKENQLNGLAAAEGYIPQMAEPTANLLTLTLSGDRLVLDREFWKEQFGGESIQTLVTRVQEQMKKSNLPKRWLSTGASSPATTRHEHVLFEHIQTAIPPQTEPNYSSYGNLSSYRRSQMNRVIEQSHLFLKLDLQAVKKVDRFGSSSSTKAKPDFFSYSVRERKSGQLSFSVTEGNDQSLSVLIADRESNSMFQLAQDKDGKLTCTIMCEGIKKSVSAANAKLLYENNQAFLKELVFPVWARFGIQTDEGFGGPFEIKNAPKPSTKK